MRISMPRLAYALLMIGLLLLMAYNIGVDRAIEAMHPGSTHHAYGWDLIFGSLFLIQLVATLCGWNFWEWLTRRSSGPLRGR